jgi:hypothetical protein
MMLIELVTVIVSFLALRQTLTPCRILLEDVRIIWMVGLPEHGVVARRGEQIILKQAPFARSLTVKLNHGKG